MKKIVIANWKMNLGNMAGIYLAEQLVALPPEIDENLKVIICPPTIIARELYSIVRKRFYLGAQDCAATEDGPYTGDISPLMIREAGCRFAILGHSERRQFHHESNSIVKQKAALALMHEITPIICIGETLQQYNAHETVDILTHQLMESLPSTTDELIIAYEPVWAIGTGKIPTPTEVEKVVLHIKNVLKGKSYKLLYGGSVTASTIKPFISIRGIDGVLVGGASIDIGKFTQLLEAIQ